MAFGRAECSILRPAAGALFARGVRGRLEGVTGFEPGHRLPAASLPLVRERSGARTVGYFFFAGAFAVDRRATGLAPEGFALAFVFFAGAFAVFADLTLVDLAADFAVARGAAFDALFAAGLAAAFAAGLPAARGADFGFAAADFAVARDALFAAGFEADLAAAFAGDFLAVELFAFGLAGAFVALPVDLDAADLVVLLGVLAMFEIPRCIARLGITASPNCPSPAWTSTAQW